MWEYGAIFGIPVVVGYWVFHPLFRPKEFEGLLSKEMDDQEEMLQQKKEEVYAAIKEMDFDYGTGKISEEDYQELTSEYKGKALEILKELDTVEGKGDIDGVIEREVRQLREKGSKLSEGDEKKTAINFCPQCGGKVTPNDNFCRRCGTRLN